MLVVNSFVALLKIILKRIKITVNILKNVAIIFKKADFSLISYPIQLIACECIIRINLFGVLFLNCVVGKTDIFISEIKIFIGWWEID